MNKIELKNGLRVRKVEHKSLGVEDVTSEIEDLRRRMCQMELVHGYMDGKVVVDMQAETQRDESRAKIDYDNSCMIL